MTTERVKRKNENKKSKQYLVYNVCESVRACV